jgi:hypothetical protein
VDQEGAYFYQHGFHVGAKGKYAGVSYYGLLNKYCINATLCDALLNFILLAEQG